MVPAAVSGLSERIERPITLIRSHRVLFDVELAVLYCVGTRRLNEQVSAADPTSS